jgi:subtilisin family serine protease
MRRPLAVALLAVLALLPRSSAAAPGDSRPGEVLVIQRPERVISAGPTDLVSTDNAAVRTLLARHGLAKAYSIGPRFGSDTPPFLRLVSTRPDFDPLQAARDLQASGLLVAAAPNIELELFNTVPNDSDLTKQWHISDPSGADVDLPHAWDVTRGSASILIGILDTGVDMGHPDLADRIWTNPGEVSGNFVDDDQNGWADDVHGWDVADNDNNPTPNWYPGFNEDLGYHGTLVAGVACASTNNTVGVAGADWNARIVPIKMTDIDGYLTLNAFTAGLRYAWRNHLDVVNVSFGAAGAFYRTYFQALVDSCRVNGVVVVAAAGNNGAADQFFPAGCDSVLSVAATNRRNERAPFSQWGTWVDVAAPGDSVWGPTQRAYTPDASSRAYYMANHGWDGARPYFYGSGTSFAAPIVSAVCALVLSRWPWLTPLEVQQRIIDTGEIVVYDHPIGRKVDAWHAVIDPIGDVPAPSPGALRLACAPTPFRDVVTVMFATPGVHPIDVDIHDVRGARVASVRLPATTRGWTWDGLDASSSRSPVGVYFVRARSGTEERVARIVRVQ